MSPVQTYTPQLPAASPFEPTASQIAVLERSAETLLNVSYLLVNDCFVQQHGYLLTQSVARLLVDLTRSLGELDPVILEALASYPVAD